MKKDKIVWRLGKLPTPAELQDLVKTEILTKEEAREILLNTETEEDRDKKSLESEIKFLRELVAKLSENRSKIVETIKYIEKPYFRYEWYQPYQYYCNTAGGLAGVTTTAAYVQTTGGTMDLASGSNSVYVADSGEDFTNIKTF